MQGEYGDQLIVAHHHKQDVFEIPWVVERVELYGAGVIPHVRIDGKYACRGASSPSAAAQAYREAIDQRLAETGGLSAVEIHGGYWLDGDSLRLEAVFTREETDPLLDTQATLLLLVDNLVWHDVWYDQVTQDAYDEEIILDQIGAGKLVRATFWRDPEWSLNELTCVAFLQQMSDSLQIYQSALLTQVGAGGIAEQDPFWILPRIASIAPNPFPGCGEVRISLELPPTGLPEDAGLELLDSEGRRLRRLSPVRLTWDGRDARGDALPTGTYWLRLTGAGAAEGKRMVVIR